MAGFLLVFPSEFTMTFEILWQEIWLPFEGSVNPMGGLLPQYLLYQHQASSFSTLQDTHVPETAQVSQVASTGRLMISTLLLLIIHNTLRHRCCCLLFSHSVVSNSLRPNGLQHTRLPCPLLSPRVCSDSCPLSQ